MTICNSPKTSKGTNLSQLCYGPVVTYCMVYHYTKRATLARLLTNEGLAIYVVHLNRYFVIPPWYYLVVTFCNTIPQSKILQREYRKRELAVLFSFWSVFIPTVTNFIQSYLHQFFDNSHSLKGYKKPSKRPFNRCQSCLKDY